MMTTTTDLKLAFLTHLPMPLMVFTMEEIHCASKITSLYEDIMAFPKQNETLVGEKGITLSRGQQRVAIAQAPIKIHISLF